MSVAVHRVPRSGGHRCSDSVCLPDYLKVTLLQRANRRTQICLGLSSLLGLARKLRSDTVKAFRHLTMTSFLKVLAKDWSFESKLFRKN